MKVYGVEREDKAEEDNWSNEELKDTELLIT